MDKSEFIKKIDFAIEKGKQLIDGFKQLQPKMSNYGDGMATFNTCITISYDSDEVHRLESELVRLQKATIAIVKSYWGENEPDLVAELYVSKPNTWMNAKSFGIQDSQEFVDVLLSYKDRIDFIESSNNLKDFDIAQKQRPYKVFISHSSEDEKFVENFVSLLEFIGVDSNEKLLCSSLDGYRIPLAEDFFEYIFKQFHSYKLFVIIIHSKNYYNSPFCLNEMGAAWVLKTDHFSILTADFDYKDMCGCINSNAIAIKVNAKDAKSRLNELKNKLVPIFKPEGVNDERWESKRDDFLKSICED
jgi:hypothetical protein